MKFKTPAELQQMGEKLTVDEMLLIAAEALDRYGPCMQLLFDRVEREYELAQRPIESAVARVKKKLQADECGPVGDLLMGAGAIAEFLGVSTNQVYRLVYSKLIPSFKLGGTVAARKSSLTAWMADLEKAAGPKDE